MSAIPLPLRPPSRSAAYRPAPDPPKGGQGRYSVKVQIPRAIMPIPQDVRKAYRSSRYVVVPPSPPAPLEWNCIDARLSEYREGAPAMVEAATPIRASVHQDGLDPLSVRVLSWAFRRLLAPMPLLAVAVAFLSIAFVLGAVGYYRLSGLCFLTALGLGSVGGASMWARSLMKAR